MFGIRYAMKRKISERAKSGEMPKAVQRASPLALAFPFCDLPNLCRRVLVWRSEATPLVIDKRTLWCQTVKISEFIIVLPIIFLDRISSI